MTAPRLPESVLDRMTPENRRRDPHAELLQFLVDEAWDGEAPPHLRRDAARFVRHYLTDREAREVLPAVLYQATGGDSGR